MAAGAAAAIQTSPATQLTPPMAPIARRMADQPQNPGASMQARNRTASRKAATIITLGRPQRARMAGASGAMKKGAMALAAAFQPISESL